MRMRVTASCVSSRLLLIQLLLLLLALFLVLLRLLFLLSRFFEAAFGMQVLPEGD